MVAELHKRGFQKVRIAPAMSPSGLHWRCGVAPANNTLASNGAQLADWKGLVASYTSAEQDRFFGWDDAPQASAGQLAELFIQRFPEICAAGHGRDWPYAGWFVEMLGLAEAGSFPVASADWELPPDHMGLIQVEGASPPDQPLPFPPPGTARPERRSSRR